MIPTTSNRYWVTTNPFDALWNVRREMDRMFSGLPAATTEGTAVAMPADVVETDHELRFSIEVPGVRSDDLNVTVENNVLTISGERKFEREDKEKQDEVHLFERRYGRFERSFTLPRRVDTDRIAASYEHGVLTIVLPKTEAAQPRRIRVTAAGNAREIESK